MRLPSSRVSQSLWSRISQLCLADPEFYRPRAIDIIIGADHYGSVIKPEIIKAGSLPPIALLSILVGLSWGQLIINARQRYALIRSQLKRILLYKDFSRNSGFKRRYQRLLTLLLSQRKNNVKLISGQLIQGTSQEDFSFGFRSSAHRQL